MEFKRRILKRAEQLQAQVELDDFLEQDYDYQDDFGLQLRLLLREYDPQSPLLDILDGTNSNQYRSVAEMRPRYIKVLSALVDHLRAVFV